MYGGSKKKDKCGVCGGAGKSCVDCAGVAFGTARYDANCNATNGDRLCVTAGKTACRADCSGVWGGSKTRDECGICGGDGTLPADTNNPKRV